MKKRKNDILKMAELLLDYYIIEDGTARKIQAVNIYNTNMQIIKAE